MGRWKSPEKRSDVQDESECCMHCWGLVPPFPYKWDIPVHVPVLLCLAFERSCTEAVPSCEEDPKYQQRWTKQRIRVEVTIDGPYYGEEFTAAGVLLSDVQRSMYEVLGTVPHQYVENPQSTMERCCVLLGYYSNDTKKEPNSSRKYDGHVPR